MESAPQSTINDNAVIEFTSNLSCPAPITASGRRTKMKARLNGRPNPRKHAVIAVAAQRCQWPGRSIFERILGKLRRHESSRLASEASASRNSYGLKNWFRRECLPWHAQARILGKPSEVAVGQARQR